MIGDMMTDELQSPPAEVEAAPPNRPRWAAWTVLVPVVTAVAGLMFGMSFQTAEGSDLRADRDLPQLVLEANERVAQRTAQLGTLQSEVDALAKAAAPGDAQLQDATSAGDALAADAARTPVRGPAITVTLDDSKVPLESLPDVYTGDDIIVHQQDVQGVVNALWAGGAEAMMIQDQRIISTSAVRCVGNTLNLQGRVYSPPYVITAIGDTTRLEAALAADPAVRTYRDYVAAVGLGWNVSVEASKELPGYTGTLDLAHARVIR
jgi:uncharacterized protein YlxW (UPF0749 family)